MASNTPNSSTGSGFVPPPSPGHSVANVLTLTLVPERTEFPADTFPDFKVTLRNTAKVPVKFCGYMLRYRLMLAMTAKDEQGVEYGLYPFRKAAWEKYQAKNFVVVQPGQTITETLKLSGIGDEGWAFMRVSDQQPILTWKHRLMGFGPGKVEFKTGLFPGAAIYAGLDGAHDNKLDTVKLPEQISGLPAGNYSDVNKEELRASAQVKFGKKA